MSGQFNDPVRVVAFNTLEHWSDDVSKTIALEIQTRSDIEGQDVPESIRDFVDKYTGPDRLAAGLSDAIPPTKTAAGGHQGQLSRIHRTGIGDVNR